MDKQQVKEMIDAAMRQHNRNASIISLWLGVFFMAAFIDGLLRALGQIEPFMGIDVNILDDIVKQLQQEFFKWIYPPQLLN